ncbi:MAG TPA: LamG domain-containing protein, partial [Candidatus Paceibacterota bacterium]|nr:LamG domain-containing protein [Candidatus Paceibacterota bacterium]
GSDLNLSPLFSSNGLVGYWKFDEGQGTSTQDSSGNGNTGTLSASPPSWVSGKVGDALQFNGSTNNVSIPSFNYESNQQYTIVGWINDDGSSQASWISKESSWSDGFKFWGVFSAYYFRVGDGTNAQSLWSNYNTGISNNQWVYLVITRNGSAWSMYLNGQFNSSIANATIGNTNLGGPLEIGARLLGPWYFKGTIDDVRIYDRALSAAEIMALYNATR